MQFQQAFIEEGLEILNDMEKALLALDINNIDMEIIHTLFRAVHSIKGSSATFGFQEIKETSHVIETFLDQVRSNQRNITPFDVNHLLKSIDCFRNMLNCSLQKLPLDSTAYQAIIQTFTDLLENRSTETKAEAKITEKQKQPPEDSDHQITSSGWTIDF